MSYNLIGLILKYKHQKYLLRSFFVNCGYCIRLCLTRLPPVYAKILYNKRRFNDFIFDLNTAILSVRWEVQHESRFSSHKFKCHIPIAFLQFSFWPQYNFEDREIILGVNWYAFPLYCFENVKKNFFLTNTNIYHCYH